MQMDYELLVFLISSLNRQNYLTTIDFESFKESCSIEFTSDVGLGWSLQLVCMNDETFNSDKKLKKKREMVKKAKNEIPRDIELCVLKNRYSRACENFYFECYPNYNLFVPIDGIKLFEKFNTSNTQSSSRSRKNNTAEI